MIKYTKYIILIFVILLFFTGCNNDLEEVELKTESYAEDASTQSIKGTNKNNIYVYIKGEVVYPGVYCVSSNTRLYQVIEKAGGMTKNAKKDYLNLAETVVDGENLRVLSKKQYKNQIKSNNKSLIPGENNETQESSLININTGTKEQLITLTGIGESKAAAIIAYREEKGKFNSIEDLKNVSGIGDATFDNIKSMITV